MTALVHCSCSSAQYATSLEAYACLRHAYQMSYFVLLPQVNLVCMSLKCLAHSQPHLPNPLINMMSVSKHQAPIVSSRLIE